MSITRRTRLIGSIKDDLRRIAAGRERGLSVRQQFCNSLHGRLQMNKQRLVDITTGTLIKKSRSPDSPAVTLHISPFFWIFTQFSSAPGERMAELNARKVPACPQNLLWSSPVRPLRSTALHTDELSVEACGCHSRRTVYIFLSFLFFLLDFIWPLQDEILHQDFTPACVCVFFFLKPSCHRQVTSIKFNQSTQSILSLIGKG